MGSLLEIANSPPDQTGAVNHPDIYVQNRAMGANER